MYTLQYHVVYTYMTVLWENTLKPVVATTVVKKAVAWAIYSSVVSQACKCSLFLLITDIKLYDKRGFLTVLTSFSWCTTSTGFFLTQGFVAQAKIQTVQMPQCKHACTVYQLNRHTFNGYRLLCPENFSFYLKHLTWKFQAEYILGDMILSHTCSVLFSKNVKS